MANTSDTHALVRFSRNPRGQLCVALPDGTVCEGVVPVRSFPIQAPLEGISLLGTDGKEVLWLEHLDALAAPQRQLLDEEFAARELIPVVEQIVSVDSISVPSCWDVLTDRGRALGAQGRRRHSPPGAPPPAHHQPRGRAVPHPRSDAAGQAIPQTIGAFFIDNPFTGCGLCRYVR